MNLFKSLVVDAVELVSRSLKVSSSSSIFLILLSYYTLSKTVVMLPLSALVIIRLGSFFNCCNPRCSFFVKTDVLRFLFGFMVRWVVMVFLWIDTIHRAN